MKLFYMPGACSLAGHIVLEWTGAPYETVGMTRAGIKSPEFLALNPSGAVPLLQHGDFWLTENAAILGYIADQHPHARLLGDGTPRGRADVMRWVAFLNSDVHKAFLPIFKPARFLDDETRVDDLAQTARGHVRAYLQRLDARLDGRAWLAGARSVADPYLFVILRWALGKGIGLKGLDNLQHFVAAMQADAGVRAALAQEEGDLDTARKAS